MSEFLDAIDIDKFELLYNLDGTWLGILWSTICILGIIYCVIYIFKFILSAIFKLINKLK